MRYSIEPNDIRIYVKRYGFLSFAKKMGTHLSNKYSQKLLDTAKNPTIDAIKTVSKRTIQKTAEATGDLIGNKIADKITSVSKKSNKKLPNDETEKDVEKVTTTTTTTTTTAAAAAAAPTTTTTTTIKKRCITPEEKQQIIDELKASIII